MADLQKIVDDLSKLTVLEAADLAKMLEEKWGVSAAAAVAVAGPAAGGGGGAAAEEKTEFSVVLTSAGDKKIEVIKEVRASSKARRSLSRTASARTKPRRSRRPSRRSARRSISSKTFCVRAGFRAGPDTAMCVDRGHRLSKKHENHPYGWRHERTNCF